MGMDALPPAVFPDAGVRLERLPGGAVAERFQEPEQALVAGPRQAAVEEHRHGGEDDAAVGVVLRLADRGVAEPYRAVAAIAFEIRGRALLDVGCRHHAVERAQLLVRL